MRKSLGPEWRRLKNKRVRATRRVQNYEEIVGPFLTCPTFEIAPEHEQINLVEVKTKTKLGKLPVSKTIYYRELIIPLPTITLPITKDGIRFIFQN